MTKTSWKNMKTRQKIMLRKGNTQVTLECVATSVFLIKESFSTRRSVIIRIKGVALITDAGVKWTSGTGDALQCGQQNEKEEEDSSAESVKYGDNYNAEFPPPLSESDESMLLVMPSKVGVPLLTADYTNAMDASTTHTTAKHNRSEEPSTSSIVAGSIILNANASKYLPFETIRKVMMMLRCLD
jgi:hypothetical protein